MSKQTNLSIIQTIRKEAKERKQMFDAYLGTMDDHSDALINDHQYYIRTTALYDFRNKKINFGQLEDSFR